MTLVYSNSNNNYDNIIKKYEYENPGYFIHNKTLYFIRNKPYTLGYLYQDIENEIKNIKYLKYIKDKWYDEYIKIVLKYLLNENGMVTIITIMKELKLNEMTIDDTNLKTGNLYQITGILRLYPKWFVYLYCDFPSIEYKEKYINENNTLINNSVIKLTNNLYQELIIDKNYPNYKDIKGLSPVDFIINIKRIDNVLFDEGYIMTIKLL